jgi:hypothetical protein
MIFGDMERFQVPLPTIFHSFEKESPFSECVACGRKLLVGGVTYFIEKAYRRGEVIFEYAICDSCRCAANEMISLESMSNLGAYLAENIESFMSRGELLEGFDNSVQPWLKKCFFTETPRETCENFQICAECDGPNLVVSLLPMMISEEAAEIFQSLMSKRTRESFGDFTRETLNPPADFHDIPLLV